MRSLRALALTAALLVGATTAVEAQGGPPGGRRPDPASLERPLAGVEGITDQQRDTIGKIEANYKTKIGTLSSAMREAMMAARQAGGMPDMAAMTKTREEIAVLRKEEFAAVRAMLTSAQHGKFDENVKTMLAEEAAREEQMRQRMGGRPPQ